MLGVREQKKKETREAIKAAAVKLFSKKGFEQTSIEDIASEAGIGKTTVYGYFSTKDEIFSDYCVDEHTRLFSSIDLADFNGRPFLENLLTFFMVQLRFITRDRELGRQLLRERNFPAQIDLKVKENDQYYFKILNHLFAIAEEQGELKQGSDWEFLCYHFFSLYLGVLVGCYSGYLDTEDDAESALRTLFQQVMMGIAK